jgi:vanillate/4-hydroxybenzoate decarboxylase subunit D
MTKDDWTDPVSVVPRESVAGRCPECGAEHLERYPILSDGGWFMATKCQACLWSVERTPWNRLGYVVLPEDVIL